MFIVPGVCRFTIHMASGGRPVDCIWDVHLDDEGAGSRADIIADQAAIILKNWRNAILPNCSSSTQFTSVSWVDLDNPAGSVGSITSGQGVTLPQVGAISGEPFPASDAALITKVCTRRRGRRQGRLYLGGLGESQASGGVLTAGTVTALNTAFAAFLTAVDQSAGINPFAYDSNSCVVHILTRDGDGKPLTGDWSDITALSCQSRQATQRRRLRK